MLQQPAEKGGKIGIVNGFRGVAILMVILHHLFIPYAGSQPLHPDQLASDSLFSIFIADAWLGVHIFFVLSGFVLYLPYRQGRRKAGTLADFRSFYLHRAQRLLPLYYIVVLVSLALNAHTEIGSRSWFLEAGGLLSTLFVFSPYGFMPPSNIVLWSVGVEIWFSLLFPFLIVAIRRWGIGTIMVATIATCSLFMIVGSSIPVPHIGSFRPFVSGIFGTCYEFVLGMFVCHLYVQQMDGSDGHPIQIAPLLLCGVLLGWLALHLMHNAPWVAIRVLGSMLFSIAFAAVLFSSLHAGRLFQFFLENRALQMLGCMCYSVYAWHGIVMNAMLPPATSMLADTIRLLGPYIVLTLALSALSYRYIEFGHARDWRAVFLLRTGSPEIKAPVGGGAQLAHDGAQER